MSLVWVRQVWGWVGNAGSAGRAPEILWLPVHPLACLLARGKRLISIYHPLCHRLFRESGSSSPSPAKVSAAGEESSVKETEQQQAGGPSHPAEGRRPVSRGLFPWGRAAGRSALATFVVKPLRIQFIESERLWPSVSHVLTPGAREGPHIFMRCPRSGRGWPKKEIWEQPPDTETGRSRGPRAAGDLCVTHKTPGVG